MTFNTIIILTMLLCFFALSANMSANLYQQTKEIGVLRAIGVQKGSIRILYFYEALVLVTASCLMGILIGMLVAYTFAIQESLILHYAMPVFFPWQQVCVVLGLSLGCAFFSTYGPTWQLTKMEIASIFRLV